METAVKPIIEETKKSKFNFLNGKGMTFLSKIAKALMVPIAILPFAALINRVGSLMMTGFDPSDPVAKYSFIWWMGHILQVPGDVIFTNLSLFFAIGIGFGLSDDFRGEAAMAATVAFLGLVALTGPDGMAYLFYRNVMPYQTDDIYSISQPVLEALGSSNIVNYDSSIEGITIINSDDSTSIMSYQSVESFFLNKTQLLYFVTGWEIIPVADASGVANGTYVLLPTVDYMLDVGVVGGIVAGGTTAFCYNRYKTVKIPQSLSFFGGRRFIPMLAIISVWGLALIFAAIWPWCQLGLLAIGQAIASPDSEMGRVFGFGVYSFFNRLVQPLGLHHIINTFLWFQFPISGPAIGDLAGNVIDGVVKVPNEVVFGDINAFQAGILGSGIFQAGFFPLYMGGYIGIAGALTLATPKENRKEVGIFFASTAFVAFLTGIDEPILFSFIFVAPILFVINCLLVPLFGMIITAQHISLGFGFSAGLIDYLISLPLGWTMSHYQYIDGAWHSASTGYKIMSNPLWVLVWSAVMAGVYFPIFYFITIKLDIPTEGREKDENGNFIISNKNLKIKGQEKYDKMTDAIIEIVKIDNIIEVTNCTTRLRLVVKDNKNNIDDSKLKEAGFNGVVRVGTQTLQLIVGTDVEYVTENLNVKMAKSGWTKEKMKDFEKGNNYE